MLFDVKYLFLKRPILSNMNKFCANCKTLAVTVLLHTKVMCSIRVWVSVVFFIRMNLSNAVYIVVVVVVAAAAPEIVACSEHAFSVVEA